MYGLLDIQFNEEREKKPGFTAYTHLVKFDPEFKGLSNYIRGSFEDGAEMLEDILDETIKIIIANDYDIERAINMEVGGIKTVDNYIKDCAGWAVKKLRENKAKLRQKTGITEVSLYAPVERYDGKSVDTAMVEDFVPDTRVEVDKIALDIKTTIAKLIKVDGTVCHGILPMVLMQEQGAAKKEVMLHVLGVDMPSRREIADQDVFDVVQDLSSFNTNDIMNELYKQLDSAEQIDMLVNAIA